MIKIKKFFLPAFIILALAQIAAISTQIINYEKILRFGEIVTLKIAPFDPYDPFRGRYITLTFADRSIQTDKNFENNQKTFFITFGNNGNFSKIDDIFDTPPKEGKAYLKVRGYTYGNNVQITYPFDRFYMQENLALYVDKNQRLFQNNQAVAKIRVMNGKGVVEDVAVNGVHIVEFVKDRLKNSKGE